MRTRHRTAILGSILFFAACQAGPAVAPSASTPAAESPASASPAVLVGPTQWSEVGPELETVGALNDVVAVGQTVVAVGSTGSRPLVLTSSDGLTWIRAPDTAAFDTAGGAGMGSAVTSPGGVLAVGAGDGESVAWLSPDGATWEKVFESPGTSSMASVTRDGPGFAAVGAALPGLVEDFGGAAWTSADGRAWIPAPASSQLLRAPLRDVVATERGLVAVGGIDGPVSLTSTDGVTWILHEQRDVLGGGAFWAVAVRPEGGFIGVGDGGGAFSAVSDDGAAWRRGLCSGSLTDASLRAVVASATGYLAAGSVAGRAAIWTSRNGEVWSRVRADLGAGQINAITTTPYGLVAVGTSVWLGPANGIGAHDAYPPTPCGAPPPDAPLATPDPVGSPVPSGPAEEPALPSGAGEEPALPPSDAPAAP